MHPHSSHKHWDAASTWMGGFQEKSGDAERGQPHDMERPEVQLRRGRCSRMLFVFCSTACSGVRRREACLLQCA